MRFPFNATIAAVCVSIMVAYSAGMYWLFSQEVKNVRDSLPHAVQPMAGQPMATQPNAFGDQSSMVAAKTAAQEESADAPSKRQRWTALQSEFKDAVAQVFCQVNEFNWIEPYKTPTQKESAGSAFFINDAGDLITNAHVVDQAIHVAIQIPSSGKKRFRVNVIGVSPERDLALIRLTKDDLASLKKELKVSKFKYLKIGDSDAVHRGDKIMALGYPLGQQGLKSTTGVASGRENFMGQYFIQISAPINPGNSGGPSLDYRGLVVGVNTAGVPGAQNVGYIIPSNEVALFLEQLATAPESKPVKLLKKPYLGAYFHNANDNLTAFLKNPPPGGLYVVDVIKGSPFDKVGIKSGDMIYSIDGYPVDIYGEMRVPWSKEDRITIGDYVARLKLGHKLTFDYYRNGVRKKALLNLVPTEAPIRRMYPGYEKIDYEVLGGFVIMPITVNHVLLLAQHVPELIRYADVKKQAKPALFITHVMLNSPVSRVRTIGAGGIIKEVNGQKVRSLNEFRAVVPAALKTGYLTIKTTDNQFAALPVSEIIEDEQRLAATYNYPVSMLYKELEHGYKPARA